MCSSCRTTSHVPGNNSNFFVRIAQDLCNGIYIARIQHMLKTEFKLYYQATSVCCFGGFVACTREEGETHRLAAQLMNIFRSPELLLTVTGFFGAQKIDGEAQEHGILSGQSCEATRILRSRMIALFCKQMDFLAELDDDHLGFDSGGIGARHERSAGR